MSNTVDFGVPSANFYQSPHCNENSLSFHPCLISVPNKGGDTIFVYLHGGGFWQGDKKDEGDVVDFLNNLGYPFFNINYSLTSGANSNATKFTNPTNVYPKAINDVIKAYDWIQANYLDGNNKIIFIGNSSGGNLALEVGIKLNKPAIALSPILLFKEFLDDEKYKNDPPIQKKDTWGYGPGGFYSRGTDGKLKKECSFASYNKWIVENYSGGDENILNNLSITNRIDDSVKGNSFFISNSTDELVPKEQMEIVSKKLKKHGANVKTVLLKGIKHGKSYLPEIKDDINEFINSIF